MMAPLRRGDLFPPPYVAPPGAPRQAQCRLKNWTARSCLRAASRVENVPRLRLRPVRGSFFLEYRRYFPDDSFRIMAGPPRGLDVDDSGILRQLSQPYSPLRPLAEARIGVDVPGALEQDETASPGAREEPGAVERAEGIVAARHHDARKRKARARHGAEASD